MAQINAAYDEICRRATRHAGFAESVRREAKPKYRPTENVTPELRAGELSVDELPAKLRRTVSRPSAPGCQVYQLVVSHYAMWLWVTVGAGALYAALFYGDVHYVGLHYLLWVTAAAVIGLLVMRIAALSGSSLPPALHVSDVYCVMVIYRRVLFWPIAELVSPNVSRQGRSTRVSYAGRFAVLMPDAMASDLVSRIESRRRSVLAAIDSRKLSELLRGDAFSELQAVAAPRPATVHERELTDVGSWEVSAGAIASLVAIAFAIGIHLTPGQTEVTPPQSVRAEGSADPHPRPSENGTVESLGRRGNLEPASPRGKGRSGQGSDGNGNLFLRRPPQKAVHRPQEPPRKPVAAELVPERLPLTGSRQRNNLERIAPFEVKVQYRDHYYVKLTRWGTDDVVATFFIRKGETLKTTLPLGVYEMRYAFGRTWYGEEALFGPDTQYAKADAMFQFKQVGNRVSGHAVELIVQVGGNLETTPIDRDEF